jgi:hypothetical protein
MSERDLRSDVPASGAARKVRSGFEVLGKWASTAGYPDQLFFDREQVQLDEFERAKLAAVVEEVHKDLGKLTLRGYASEDEVDAEKTAGRRLAAVLTALKSIEGARGDPSAKVEPGAWDGNLDYRWLRRVEIVTPSTPPALDCSGGGRVECVTGGYAVGEALDRGRQLLERTLDRLEQAPVAELFGDPPPTARIGANLLRIRDQLERYRRPAPADDPNAGGHECFNACAGKLQARNDRQGAAARMALGILHLTSTPDGRAICLVHEASHATEELATFDNAYHWQRRFDFLTPEEALENADSYAMLVARANGLTEAPFGTADEEARQYDLPPRRARTRTAGIPAEAAQRVAFVRAWLEHYVTQALLEVRDLYIHAAEAIRKRTWTATRAFYRDSTYRQATDHLGLPAVNDGRPVPDRTDLAEIGGIFDRVGDLEQMLNFERVVFASNREQPLQPGESDILITQAQWELPRSELARWMLADDLQATTSVPADFKQAYVDYLVAMSAKHGGPFFQ